MAIIARPAEMKHDARPKWGSVANILAQSKVVSDAFGRPAGFVLMMTGLFVFLAVSVVVAMVVSKGAVIALGSLAKAWL